MSFAHAAPAPTVPDPATDIAWCTSEAARDFNVPRVLILLILDTEGGWLGASPRNTNGTLDLGPMQVNTSWLPRLAGFGVTRERLQNHACTNVYVGTWILAKLMQEHDNMVDVIAHYHSPTPVYQQRYLGRVREHLVKRLAALQTVAQPLPASVPAAGR